MGAVKDEDDGSEAPAAEELTAAAGVLRRVLAEIDAERLPADLDHAAYIRGAADALSMLAGAVPKPR